MFRCVCIGKYLIGELPDAGGPQGMIVASGCNGSGLSSAGGFGRILAAMYTDLNGGSDRDWDVERELFAPNRFDLNGDFFSEQFRSECVAARAKKFRKTD